MKNVAKRSPERAKLKSFPITESKINFPIPGNENIVSVITAPENKYPKSNDRIVTIGTRLARNA